MGTNSEQNIIDEAKSRLEKGENPMNLKKELAKIIVSELHGEDAVSLAEEHFRKTVVEKVAGEDAPSVVFSSQIPVLSGEESLLKAVLDKGLVESASEFKRLLDEGAIYKDEVRLTRESLINTPGVVRIGKRKYLKLVK